MLSTASATIVGAISGATSGHSGIASLIKPKAPILDSTPAISAVPDGDASP
jgi:hypothetical protein